MTDFIKDLRIGDILQLQWAPPSENLDRYASRLIGYLPDQSLVITTPRKKDKVILVREGHSFLVRMLQGGNIWGFTARVLMAQTRPYPHLHLEFPQDVESAVVRNAPRVNCNVSAVISVTEGAKKETPVLIVDLSSTGCKLMLSGPYCNLGEMVQLSFSVKTCSGEDTLVIMGALRNVREIESVDGKTDYVHGIQFSGMTRFQQLMLCSYVLERL